MSLLHVLIYAWSYVPMSLHACMSICPCITACSMFLCPICPYIFTSLGSTRLVPKCPSQLPLKNMQGPHHTHLHIYIYIYIYTYIYIYRYEYMYATRTGEGISSCMYITRTGEGISILMHVYYTNRGSHLLAACVYLQGSACGVNAAKAHGKAATTRTACAAIRNAPRT